MAFRHSNLEFLNHNAMRAYPLAADVTGEDVTASFKIPTDFIVELILSVHSGINVQPGRFFLKKINASATGYKITVGYATDSAEIDVATAQVAVSTFTPNKQYQLGGLGAFFGCRGTLVIGSLAGVTDQPTGDFNFSLSSARLETDAIRPSVLGVTSLQVENGGNLSSRLHGAIVLVAGKNMQITAVPAEGDEPARLVFDAIEGRGLVQPCACADNTATSIYTINGIPPTADGEFSLLGDDCIKVDPLSNGIQLTDECSKPCCGCPEQTVLTQTAQAITTQAASLENYLSRLEGQISAMSAILGTL